MKLLLCIGALLIIFSLVFAAAADLRTGSKRATSVWMLAGAVIAAAGILGMLLYRTVSRTKLFK